MDTTTKLVETLSRSAMVQNYERAFTEATGMPMALRTVETWQLPFHGQRNENGFCAQMAGQSHACAACLQLQASLAHAAMNKPATRTCTYGLCETAVPVKLGLKTIAFLQTGQVMRRQPTEASFQRAVVRAGKLGVDISSAPMKQAYFATPIASQKRLDAVTGLLGVFADHLAMKSNQIVVQTKNVEPPIVARAKQFISEHLTEVLSLRRVSDAVSTSRFNLCKLFRKATGLTLTDFTSRTRIEKAKNLLLNPNLRISEIAYEVGFQSLTHFNRVFRRIMGQSPTAFRQRLPSAIQMSFTPKFQFL